MASQAQITQIGIEVLGTAHAKSPIFNYADVTSTYVDVLGNSTLWHPYHVFWTQAAIEIIGNQRFNKNKINQVYCDVMGWSPYALIKSTTVEIIGSHT